MESYKRAMAIFFLILFGISLISCAIAPEPRRARYINILEAYAPIIHGPHESAEDKESMANKIIDRQDEYRSLLDDSRTNINLRLEILDAMRGELKFALTMLFLAGEHYTIKGQTDKAKQVYQNVIRIFVGATYSGYRDRARMEIENLKSNDAERGQLAAEGRKVEAERQQLAMSKLPSVSTAGETTRDGRFIAYNNATVFDTKTNLMWAAKDNGSNINWENAKSYCENYRGGGYTDWRMPTLDELAGLYDSNKSYKATQSNYNVHLTEFIQLSACCPWASETRGSGAAFFGFDGNGRHWFPQSYSLHDRALPVRSGK